MAGAAKQRLVPKGFQNVAETGYIFVRDQIAVDVIGPKDGLKYAPYLASLFFFIFFQNLLEVVPGINFPTTSRMAIPAFLALLTLHHFQRHRNREAGSDSATSRTRCSPRAYRERSSRCWPSSSWPRSSSSAPPRWRFDFWPT